tara:strand:+ start:437 stop:607 length:171 start_codon:yes stop_codon:yes gene_type:complete
MEEIITHFITPKGVVEFLNNQNALQFAQQSDVKDVSVKSSNKQFENKLNQYLREVK